MMSTGRRDLFGWRCFDRGLCFLFKSFLLVLHVDSRYDVRNHHLDPSFDIKAEFIDRAKGLANKNSRHRSILRDFYE